MCREKYIEFENILNNSCKCFDITSLKIACVEKKYIKFENIIPISCKSRNFIRFKTGSEEKGALKITKTTNILVKF